MLEDSASQYPQVPVTYTRFIYTFILHPVQVIHALYAAAHFNPVSQQVVLAADEVAVVQVVLPLGVRQDMVQSHCGSVSGLAYSACFNHLVTSCTSGVSSI